jgi:SAM-dependent methyltransferase
MAHIDQRKFVEKIKNIYPKYFNNIRVIDCGSYDVNGNIKDVFINCEYIGVDNHNGPNVDWVIPLHHIDTPGSVVDKYDTVISCEMLEHDYYWERSLKKMYNILKPNGLLVITCAGYNRREHGVEEFASDPKQSHYENLTISHLVKALDLEFLFSDFGVEYNGSGGEMGDLYFWGIKR